MIRRGSASLVSSGLYSLNSSVSQQLLSITIQAQEGETCKHACVNNSKKEDRECGEWIMNRREGVGEGGGRGRERVCVCG